MNEANFLFLQRYLGLFTQIPTARESQATWLGIYYGVILVSVSVQLRWHWEPWPQIMG